MRISDWSSDVCSSDLWPTRPRNSRSAERPRRMSILYDEGQQAIASESRRILEAHVTTEALLPLLETRDAIFEPFWTIAKEQGWTAVALPEAYGGLGLGLVELGLVAHQAGRSPLGRAHV